MATFPNAGQYCDMVEPYIQNPLPQEGIRPSLERLSHQRETDGKRPPPRSSQTDQDLPLLMVANSEESESNEESDHELSMVEVYKDANVETQHFIEAAIEYERSAVIADPKYKASIDWSHTHTWEEVLEELEKAAQSYSETTNVWGKVRKVFRSVGGNQQVFVAWLDLLPAQSQYCSIICGGLKLIFGAASRLNVLREEASSALTQIPLSLARTGKTLKIFGTSAELHRCSSALYVAILATLEHILRYYKGNSAKRLMKATLKQGIYESKLSDKIKAMEIQSEVFKDLATQCAYQTQVSTLDEVRSLTTHEKARTRSIMQNIAHSRSEATLQQLNTAKVIKSESESSQRRIQDLQNSVAQLKEDHFKLHNIWKSDFDGIAELKEMLKEFHRSNRRIDRRSDDTQYSLYPEPNRMAGISALAKKRLSVTEKLLVVLKFDPDSLAEIVDSNQRYVWTLSRSAQDRAVTLMESQKLHIWLTDAQPSALFVNGNYDASARQSPISYVSSKLIDSICPTAAGMRARYSSIFAQAFFCRQHPEIGDPATGPVSMMRSLLSQLIVGYNAFDISTLMRMLERDLSDVSQLCTIFSDLIKEIPQRCLVFCIIDGITIYEDSPALCQEAVQATKALLRIMEDCKDKGCLFKLLITTPGVSRLLYQEFEDEETIWMPTRVDSHGGLTPAKWGASAGVHIDEWLP